MDEVLELLAEFESRVMIAAHDLSGPSDRRMAIEARTALVEAIKRLCRAGDKS